VAVWCASRRLQLNANKTEVIWFGSRINLAKLNFVDCSVLVGSESIKPSTVVHDLGVDLDAELNMKRHVAKVAASSPTSDPPTGWDGSDNTTCAGICNIRSGLLKTHCKQDSHKLRSSRCSVFKTLLHV
jgi:hypothetical protein